MLIVSFVNAAGGASPSSALRCGDPSAGTVSVPASRVLYFDVAGGGGRSGTIGATGAGIANGDGGAGWVELYLDSLDNPIENERCLYP